MTYAVWVAGEEESQEQENENPQERSEVCWIGKSHEEDDDEEDASDQEANDAAAEIGKGKKVNGNSSKM